MLQDLGSRDLAREKLYLVCYVIRIGGMETKEPDKENKRSSKSNIGKPSHPTEELLRRPFGVAAIDIVGKLDGSEDKHHFLPFLS